MMNFKASGRVRPLELINAAENNEDEEYHINAFGDQLVVQALPPVTELVRMGESWQMMAAATTALSAIPTTSGKLTLWNGEPTDGKCYAIDSVAVTKVLIDVTTNDLFSVFCQIIKYPMTAPTNAGLAMVSLCGKPNYAGRARSVASSTTLSNMWDCIWNQMDGYATAIAGSAWEQVDIPLYGKYIIPPRAAFTMTFAEITATSNAFRQVIRWHEVQLPYVS